VVGIVLLFVLGVVVAFPAFLRVDATATEIKIPTHLGRAAAFMLPRRFCSRPTLVHGGEMAESRGRASVV
jgi:hypothetical protein